LAASFTSTYEAVRLSSSISCSYLFDNCKYMTANANKDFRGHELPKIPQYLLGRFRSADVRASRDMEENLVINW